VDELFSFTNRTIAFQVVHSVDPCKICITCSIGFSTCTMQRNGIV
jgi:hypothetical protein